MEINPENQKSPQRIKNKWVFIVLFLLIITNAVSLFFYFRPKVNNNQNFNFPLLNPSRRFLEQKDMIVNVQALRDDLQKIGEDKSISIYFELLNTGANISINKDAEYFPASLLKLPLAMTVVKKIERGEWGWEDELSITAVDQDDRYGDLYKQPVGTKITIQKLIEEMLINSDNTAYLVLLRSLESNEFRDTQEHLGLQDFFSQDGKISAKNYSVILRTLYNASYLSFEDSDKLIKLMSHSETNEYLSGGIPKDVLFSHKIGVSQKEGVHLDAGIVYVPNRPYFLVVMISSPNQDEAKKEMKEISEKIYKFVSNYNVTD